MDIKEYIESGVIEGYVLGLASAEEAAELELLMKNNAVVKQAVDSFANALEKNALLQTVAPPADLKDKIMAALFNEESRTNGFSAPAIPLTASQKKDTLTPVIKSNFWRKAAAAAILLLAAIAALNFYFYRNYQKANNQYEALLTERSSMQAGINVMQTHLKYIEDGMHIINGPETKKIKMGGVPGRETSMATVYWDMQSKDVYLSTDKLPKAPDGKQYQLWAIVDGKPVDAGMVSDCISGFCKMKNIPNAQAFAITLEKQGGNHAPTMDQMYTLGNV